VFVCMCGGGGGVTNKMNVQAAIAYWAVMFFACAANIDETRRNLIVGEWSEIEQIHERRNGGGGEGEGGSEPMCSCIQAVGCLVWQAHQYISTCILSKLSGRGW